MNERNDMTVGRIEFGPARSTREIVMDATGPKGNDILDAHGGTHA